MIPEKLEVRVVGVTFQRHYPLIAYRLMVEVPTRVKLEREPDNPYDKNAVLVRWGEKALGHIDRYTAKRLAPSMDKGVRWRAWAVRIEVHPDNPDNPGIWLQLESFGRDPVRKVAREAAARKASRSRRVPKVGARSRRVVDLD